MIAASENLFRLGIYSPQEAAFYARVKPQLLTRWLYGTARDLPVIEPQYGSPKKPDRIVSFLDFVQTLSIRAIRTQYKEPLQKIRQAIEFAQRKGYEYPFAMRGNKAFIIEKGRQTGDIVIEIDGNLIVASGKERSQHLMRQIVQVHLLDLSYDQGTGLATRYTAFRGEGGQHITMDPHQRFGEPLLACGYSALALWEAVKNEGGTAEAAAAYGVDEQDIILACRYFDHLLSDNAA